MSEDRSSLANACILNTSLISVIERDCANELRWFFRRQLHGRSREHFRAPTRRTSAAIMEMDTQLTGALVMLTPLAEFNEAETCPSWKRTHTVCRQITQLHDIIGLCPVTVLTSPSRRMLLQSALQQSVFHCCCLGLLNVIDNYFKSLLNSG